jgi:hypothetical protein
MTRDFRTLKQTFGSLGNVGVRHFPVDNEVPGVVLAVRFAVDDLHDPLLSGKNVP